MRVNRGPLTLLLFGALAWRFFQPQAVGRKRFFSNTTPKSWRPDWLIGPECTPANERIQTIIARLLQKLWRAHATRIPLLWRLRHTHYENLLEFIWHKRCSSIDAR